MSRRQLTLAIAAVASLLVTACGALPTAPQRAPAANADTAPTGWSGSSG